MSRRCETARGWLRGRFLRGESLQFSPEFGEAVVRQLTRDVAVLACEPALSEASYAFGRAGPRAGRTGEHRRNRAAEVVEGLFTEEDGDRIEEMLGPNVTLSLEIRDGRPGRKDVCQAERFGHENRLAGVPLFFEVPFTAGPAGENELLDDGGELLDLRFAHPFEQAGCVLADLVPEAVLDLDTLGFEPDLDSAAVIGSDFATDKAPALEPLQQRRDGRASDIEPVSKFGVAEATLVVQVAEEAELGDGEVLPVPYAEPDLVQEGARLEEGGHGLLELRGSRGFGHGGSLWWTWGPHFSWAVRNYAIAKQPLSLSVFRTLAPG